MKKFFEKYDLLKVSGILVLLSVVLTWILPITYYQGGQLVTEEITRLGLTGFLNYGLLCVAYHFTVLVTFLLVLGGFYQVLSKRPGYQKLVKSISEKLKGREIPVTLIVSLIFAILGSLVNEYFPLFVLIPFVIAILNRMKVDKIAAFVSTFGGLLVGTIGSTYSSKVTGYLMNTFAVETADVLTTQTILFVVAFILLSIFTILRLRKTSKDKKFVEYDVFAFEDSKDKKAVKTWPYIIMIVLLIVAIPLAYMPWATWNVTIFQDITTWINEFEIFGQPILSYVFGTFTEFGKWDLFTIQYVMLAATLLIHWFGRVSWNEIFQSYGEGFKKIGKTVAILVMVYFVLELAVQCPVVPGIVDWIAGLTDNFNAIVTFIGASITSLVGVEMQYVMQLSGTFYAAAFKDMLPELLIIFQSAFGLISFVVPSSAILMLGLSYLDIPYKDWLKFIWKFLLAMLIIVIIIILIIA